MNAKQGYFVAKGKIHCYNFRKHDIDLTDDEAVTRAILLEGPPEGIWYLQKSIREYQTHLHSLVK